MNKLWLVPVIVFVLAIVLALSVNHNNQDKTSKLPPAEARNAPVRIVSLAPNITEILFAMGLGEKVVAVSSDSDWPDQTATMEKVGTFWRPNTEAVIAARPDLVIALAFEQQRAVVESLSRLNYPVLTLKLDKIEELPAAIQKIGLATGCGQQADELTKKIDGQLQGLKSRLHSTENVKVLWVIQPEPLRVAGRNTFVNQLIELAGGENAVGPTIQQYPLLGTEGILRCAPQAIIQSAMTTDNLPRQQQAAEAFWSKWPDLPAVKNNKIYVVESDTVLRLGPRLPQGVELIARCLHPNVFKQEDKVGKKSDK